MNILDESLYAIKKIKIKVAGRSLQKEICSVLQEIRYLAKLKHDNIVTYNHSWVEVNIRERDLSEEYNAEEDVEEVTVGGFWNSSGSSSSAKGSRSEKNDCEFIIVGNRKYYLDNIDSISIFIQMELCKETLSDYIEKRNKKLPNSYIYDALKVFETILNGVEYIHKENVIHRDFKPKNIFFTFDDKIKIGDLGLATKSLGKNCEIPSPSNVSFEDKEYTEQQSGEFEDISFHLEIEEIKNLQLVDIEIHSNGVGKNQITNYDQAIDLEIHTANIGTMQYAAPEQLGDIHYDKKVDIYSLGLILLDLIYPYKTQMEKSDTYSSLKKERTLKQEFFKDNIKLTEIVLKCTELDPNKRPDIFELKKIIADLINFYSINIGTSVSIGKQDKSLCSEYSQLTTNTSSANIKNEKRRRYLSEDINHIKPTEFLMRNNNSSDSVDTSFKKM
jgi:serine/threonine protein kinase